MSYISATSLRLIPGNFFSPSKNSVYFLWSSLQYIRMEYQMFMPSMIVSKWRP